MRRESYTFIFRVKALVAFLMVHVLDFLRACCGVLGVGRSFYVLFSSKFHHEQRAVFQGLQAFRNHSRRGHNDYELRRCIHRIEKGLIMKPQRPIFALDYIVTAVSLYKACVEAGCNDRSLQAWACDVLAAYFDVVQQHSIISRARAIYISVQVARSTEDIIRVPATRGSQLLEVPAYEQMLSLARQRRSIRWYQSRKVPRDLLDQAFMVAKLAPSACNRQPFDFVIVDADQELRDVLAVPGGTAGWSHSPPMAIVVVGHLDAFYEERDRHLIYIDGALSSMSLLFALECLGLSSCLINFPDIEEKNEAMRKILSLPESRVPVMVISVGFADPEALVPFSEKKSLSGIRHYGVDR